MRKSSSIGRISDLRRLELLSIRSYVSQAIHTFLAKDGFLSVQSPTITGSWVKGRTMPFTVNFYDEECYLSISNMLYHQVILGAGFSRIYELGKLHRKETPSTQQKLAEFTILDIGMANTPISGIMTVFEEVLKHVHDDLSHRSFRLCRIPEKPQFDRIDCTDLLTRCGLERTTGSQLPTAVRDFLRKHFRSFVWVTGFR